MPLYLSVPLPGPFRYSKRIGGHKRHRKVARAPKPPRQPMSPRTKKILWIVLGSLITLGIVVKYWWLFAIAAGGTVLVLVLRAQNRTRDTDAPTEVIPVVPARHHHRE